MFVVDRHHKVLTAWAEYRRTLARAPRLITLDHHTDTSKPFRDFLRRTLGPKGIPLTESETAGLRQTWLEALDFRRPESVTESLARLNNDEHITTAIATNIISSAFVIAHSAMDTDLAVYREHKIMCRAVDGNSQSGKITRADCDQVLESEFLRKMIAGFDSLLSEAGEPALMDEPYILDIDLDYFNTRASIAPVDATMIRTLAKGAGLITIATEPSYVVHCALDEGLTSGFLLERLKALIEGGS